MPLFGSSHKHDNDNKLEKRNPANTAGLEGTGYNNAAADVPVGGTATGAGVGGRHHQEGYQGGGTGSLEGTGYNNAAADVPVGGTVAGAGIGGGRHHHHEVYQAGAPAHLIKQSFRLVKWCAGAGGTGTVGMGEPGMGNQATVGGGRHHQAGGVPQAGMGNPAVGNPGMRNDEMMANPQYTTGVGAGAGGPAIPPANTINTQPQHHSGGGGATTGKIEHAIGSLVGSNTLKAKGLQKEQEAQGLKVQSTELSEAERLEREAGLRRERAVAHGAHPDNRHVGATAGSGPGTY